MFNLIDKLVWCFLKENYYLTYHDKPNVNTDNEYLHNKKPLSIFYNTLSPE